MTRRPRVPRLLKVAFLGVSMTFWTGCSEYAGYFQLAMQVVGMFADFDETDSSQAAFDGYNQQWLGLAQNLEGMGDQLIARERAGANLQNIPGEYDAQSGELASLEQRNRENEARIRELQGRQGRRFDQRSQAWVTDPNSGSLSPAEQAELQSRLQRQADLRAQIASTRQRLSQLDSAYRRSAGVLGSDDPSPAERARMEEERARQERLRQDIGTTPPAYEGLFSVPVNFQDQFANFA